MTCRRNPRFLVLISCLTDQNIRISRAELAHFSGREEQAVEYPDGLGYMAQLRVYHDLHCLVSGTGISL